MAGPEYQRPYRLSDAERDEALVRLRTAFEEGRLDIDEHEERASLAVRAATSSDLVPLFDDLPATNGSAPGSGHRSSQGRGDGRAPVPGPRREDGKAAPAASSGCADAGSRSAPWWGVLPWVGFVFLFWGLPAVLNGSTEALVGWGIFLTVMIVPHVVVGVARHRHRST
ncbi:DUF1707 SHOCT-like domain-containing protein [Nocardiopsis alborubida]|uniref:DUF1707 domain-containing protein n=1 Tax=Nocardiopsis alborubida TaxID=146802 RepID=A0A7X6MHL2_9ACTN|nr:DUF1707 domain-containing protein [Nocardiopsis alborubida]NKY99853.1 DUF1707 domain-containing protein [Nocardiopsis alborubida]